MPCRWFVFCVLFCLSACIPGKDDQYSSFGGNTMGTYYSVKASGLYPGCQEEVDSLLRAFNRLFSTYDPQSVISGFNQSSDTTYCILDEGGHFLRVLEISDRVYRETHAYFDPTVQPLVSYWGFSKDRSRLNMVDTQSVDSLLLLVGFRELSWTVAPRAMCPEQTQDRELCIDRNSPRSQLDLSAVAKGYGVDLIAEFLETRGIKNYMVDIGGEITASGNNPDNRDWVIGIEQPVNSTDLENRSQQAIVRLRNKSVATSGNYRNFYELDGRMIGHTINPFTGFPESNDLLSVTVMANNCMYADALATGFMAVGYPKAHLIADSLKDVEAMFLTLDSVSGTIQEHHTAGFSDRLHP